MSKNVHITHRAFGLRALLVVAGLSSCGTDPLPVAPAGPDAGFVLRVAGDGALFLDGKPMARRELARGLARLADRARVEARLAGKPVNPGHDLPSAIVFQVAGETPVATFGPMMGEARSAGFRGWKFALDRPDGSAEGRPAESGPSRSARKESGDLPAELKTFPIRLRADARGNAVRPGLGEREFPDLDSLGEELASILDDPESNFDRATLAIDPGLHFADLLRAVDLLASLGIRAVAFQVADPD